MSKDVIVKRNKYGIRLVLDEQTPFPELLESVADKFRETGSFFKDARVALSFEGRQLTDRQTLEMVNTIEENSSLHILCVMDSDERLEEKMRRRLLDAETDLQEAAAARAAVADSTGAADFYRGNLRSGQVLECASSVTLIGDVNPGARIISGGNIVILGSLKGNACAGASGDENCFIFALEMKPIQLQIGDVIAKSPDREKKGRGLRKKETASSENNPPQIATARDGTICIEPVSKGSFH